MSSKNPVVSKDRRSNYPNWTVRISLLGLSWILIFQALVGCDDILILGKSPVKWRQHPNC